MSSTAPPFKSRYVSLQVKLIVAFTLVFTLVFGGVAIWLVNFTRSIAFDTLQRDLNTVLDTAFKGIDGDEFEQIYANVDDAYLEDAAAITAAQWADGDDTTNGFYPTREENPLYWQHVEWLLQVHNFDQRVFLYSFVAIDGDPENPIFDASQFVSEDGQPRNIIFIGSHGAPQTPQGGAAFLSPFPLLTRCDIFGQQLTGRLAGLCNTLGSIGLPYERGVGSDGRPYIINRGEENVIALTQPAFVSHFYQDQYGEWISAFRPITNSQGEIVGVLGADYEVREYVGPLVDRVLQGAVIAFLISFVILLVIVVLVARTITRPTAALTRIAARIGEGDYEQDLSPLYNVRLTDEISTLAHVFEVMVSKVYQREQNLRKQVEELQIMVDSTKRDRQVQEIVDSDFFQDLQAKANAIKKRGKTGPLDETKKKSGKSKS